MDQDREWRQYLIEEMRDIRSEIKELRKENKAILETLTTLKVKIGVAAGIIGGLASMFVDAVRAKFGQ